MLKALVLAILRTLFRDFRGKHEKGLDMPVLAWYNFSLPTTQRFEQNEVAGAP